MARCTTQELIQRFRASGQAVPYIIYDIDDVLWDLIGYVAQCYHIPIERAAAVFNIRDNPQLNPDEQEAIIAAFSDPHMFENIQFVPGVADILRPRELGARVGINSNCFNERIAELKRDQLLAAIPDLRPEDLQLNIIHYGETHHKKFAPNMTILVDDSPHNVALSPALLNVMPMSVRWAWSADALQRVSGKPVVWQTDLIAVNQYVYDTVATIMDAQRRRW